MSRPKIKRVAASLEWECSDIRHVKNAPGFFVIYTVEEAELRAWIKEPTPARAKERIKRLYERLRANSVRPFCFTVRKFEVATYEEFLKKCKSR